MPPAAMLEAETISAKASGRIAMSQIVDVLQRGGFERVTTVRDRGEFAVRGGILDLFAPGAEEPLRLDFFGDTLESIRAFDPATQRTTGGKKSFELAPVSEVDAEGGDDQPLPHQLCEAVRRADAQTTASMPP